MVNRTLLQSGDKILALVSAPAFVSTILLLIVLSLIPRARALAIQVVCHVYIALVDRPFRLAPTDFIFAGEERPLPRGASIWSRVQASTTLKWRAQRKGLQHEKHIDWDSHDSPRNGDMIEAWDRIAEWDPSCLHPRKLDRLRQVGDTLADNALDQIHLQSGSASGMSTDTLSSICNQASVDSNTAGQATACQQFWKAIDRRPPPGAGALSMDWYLSRHGKHNIESLEQWPKYPSTNQQEPSSTVPIWSPQSTAALDAQDELEELEAEAQVIRRGQDVFYRYAGPMLTVLLHFSLAGGFASPRITEVLKQTAYLVPSAASKADRDKPDSSTNFPKLPTVEDLRQMFNVDKSRADRTWNRLLETTQYVLDVMENADSLCPPSLNTSQTFSPSAGSSASKEEAGASLPEKGGEGWQSAVRVRLLHANVRRRVLKLVEKHRQNIDSAAGSAAVYDLEKNGIPINQEDLLGTLCAFSTAPLAMLQRIGISPTAQEREDYTALWRHLGFYMGIEPGLLRRAFCDAPTADRTLWCTVLHLFSQVEVLGVRKSSGKGASGPRLQGPTIPVLIACADRPPFHTPLSAHIGIARRLLGKSLADSLALPASSAKREVLTDIAFLGMRIPILFGSYYPRASWEKKKLELTRPLLRRLVVFSFGNKRTKFEMPDHSREKKGEEGVHVETRSDNYEQVPEDRERNLRLARQWHWLMREMLAVLFLLASSSVGVIILAYVHHRSVTRIAF